MSTHDVLPLDVILGPEPAARLLQHLADDLVRQDHLTPSAALRAVCERATDCDPLLLAAPGQVWVRHPDVDPGEVAAERLAVYGRDACPPRLLVAVVDDDQPGEAFALPPEALLPYTLESWTLAPWGP